MHFYGLKREEVLRLSVSFFWLLNNCIERISAQTDLRSLSVASVSQDSESATAHRKNLIMELGDVVKKRQSELPNAERDVAGIQDLMAMAKQKIGI